MNSARIEDMVQGRFPTVDCLIEAGDWPDEAVLFALATKAVEAAWAQVDPGAGSAGEVSVVFTDDTHIRALNAEWRGKDRATNVLSFPATSPHDFDHPAYGAPVLLGDIIVACGTLRREAEAEDKTVDDHLTHLIVHGFLHLSGYDHETDAQAEEMESLERRILHSLAIADPYA